MQANSNYQGDLLISLSYCPRSCKLEGIIHKATGLKKCDTFGLSGINISILARSHGGISHSFKYVDPFVKVKITFKNRKMFKWKTSVKHKTLAPVYNECFSYEVTEDMRMAMDIENVMISFAVFDHDHWMPNDKMGYVSIGKDADSKLGRQHWDEVLKCSQHRISFWHPIQLATAAQKHQMRSRCASPIPQ